MSKIDFLYHYKATVVSVYDGDTITVDLDFGMGLVRKNVKLRLHGVNTPELRGPDREEGLAIRDLVREFLPEGEEVVIRTFKDKTGKYGRLLAEVWCDPPLMIDVEPLSLNEYLIQMGFPAPESWKEG